MAIDVEEKVTCRTPADDRDGVTNIPAWKYKMVRKAILHAVECAGPQGLPFSELTQALRARVSEGDLSRLGSLGWHATTVKLNMEVDGELRRADGPGPQRLLLASL